MVGNFSNITNNIVNYIADDFARLTGFSASVQFQSFMRRLDDVLPVYHL
jgi:hypothetical protein